MNMILLTARLLLAAVFTVAAVAKLSDQRGSEQAITDMGLPSAFAPFLAWAVPIIELAIAVMLLPATSAWWGTLAALALLAVFTILIAINLWRGRAPDCHCFGQMTAGPIGRGTLIRNLGLIVLAILPVLNPQQTASVSATAWLVELTTGERALVIIGALVIALLIAVVVLLVRLLKQNERLITAMAESQVSFADEMDEPVVRKDLSLPSSGLPVGAPAPEFELADLDGQTTTLADLLEPGLSLALFFVSPACGPCAAMLGDVKRWQEQYAELLSFAFISSGSSEANQAKFADAGTVLLQNGSEVSAVYEAKWTPAALIVKADGSIGSQVAYGSEAIRRLIIQTITAMGSDHAAAHVDAQHNGHADEPTVSIGQPAPTVSLPDLNGQTVTLDDFKGERTLVVFWNPNCSFCAQILDALKQIEANPPRHAPRLLVISNGAAEANREAGLQSPMLLDGDFTAGQKFGATGTPSAVLIDQNGNIASEVVSGAPRVLALAGVREAAH